MIHLTRSQLKVLKSETKKQQVLSPFAWLYQILRLFYITIYYYFMPFTVILFTFFSEFTSGEKFYDLIRIVETLIDLMKKNK